jgi:hypothetical protein
MNNYGIIVEPLKSSNAICFYNKYCVYYAEIQLDLCFQLNSTMICMSCLNSSLISSIEMTKSKDLK